MLPVAYRVVKGFATFFGVMGILSCICGLIAGIIVNDPDKKPKPLTQSSLSGNSGSAPSAERGEATPAGPATPLDASGVGGSGGSQASGSAPTVQSRVT